MTTLVTGAGLIGTLTARHLAEQGEKVSQYINDVLDDAAQMATT